MIPSMMINLHRIFLGLYEMQDCHCKNEASLTRVTCTSSYEPFKRFPRRERYNEIADRRRSVPSDSWQQPGFSGTFPFDGASSLARPTVSIMGRTYAIEITRARDDGTKDEPAQRVNSRASWLSSEKSKIKALGNYIGQTRSRATRTTTFLPFTSRSLVNRHRARVPLAFISQIFHCRFTVVLSRIFRSKVTRSWYRAGADPRARKRTSSFPRSAFTYPGDKNPK